jgi:hypothetical protein
MESQNNKALLWNLMTQNGLFKDINSNYYQMVQEEFETSIPLIEGRFGSSKPLIEKNKIFLSDMIERLNKFKGEGMYTAQQMREANQSQFNNALSNHESNFKQAIEPLVPKQVSFADPDIDGEEPIDIDAMLEKKQRERNLELDMSSEVGLNSGVVHTDSIPAVSVAVSSKKSFTINDNENKTGQDVVLQEQMLQKILENQTKIFEKLELLNKAIHRSIPPQEQI